MENTLIDRETLGQFIDELIKKKPLPVNTTEELSNFREEQIKALDDRISEAIFGRFTKEQNRQFNQLLNDNEEDPEVFDAFFIRSNINVEEIMTETLKAFALEFLGGQNE